MKSPTALIVAFILGFFTYGLPLYADSPKEYHLVEKTVVGIPIVGEITTLTTSYLSGCKLKENTTLKLHNVLVKALSNSDGISHEMVLSDLCEEVQWVYDAEKGVYEASSFETLREQVKKFIDDDNTHIDMDSDHNDINDIPEMSHKILPGKKNINGFKTREVLTTVYLDGKKQPVIIREYYTTEAKALTRIIKARESLFEELGYEEKRTEGIPDLIKLVYDALREDQEWERPDGEVVRFVITIMDDDSDPILIMNYDVEIAEITNYQADHFSVQ